MSVATKDWWEAVCCQLDRDPKTATKTITEFRESSEALEASKYFLQQSTGCSPAAQFQAALVLQYVFLKQWSSLTASAVQELRNTLWMLIHTSIAARSMPTFALNKIIQVYALLWKRGWNDTAHSQRRELFQHISAFLQVPELMKAGAVMLRTVVEEFSSRSSAEVGLPLEFHRVAHQSFEADGLDDAISIAVHSLSLAISSLQVMKEHQISEVMLQAVANISESSKLFVEVINWDFGNVDRFTWVTGRGASERDKMRSSELLALPRSWAQHFLQAKFFDDIFNSYDKLRLLLFHTINRGSFSHGFGGLQQSAFSSPADHATFTNSIVACLGELRLLMTAVASICGNFFVDDGEKITIADYLVSRLNNLIESALSTVPPSKSSISAVSTIDEMRSQECNQLGSVLLRLLGNFRLPLISRMPHFEGMMTSLARATFELSRELAGLAEGQLSALFGTGNSRARNEISGGCALFGEPGLLENWRAEALEVFLECWCMVLDDPLILRDTVACAGDDREERDGMGSIQGVGVVQQLRAFLRTMAGDVFKQLFECILRTALCDALKSLDEEEEEENEAIEGRTMDDLLGSIGTAGRITFGVSVTHVCTSLSATLQDAQKLLQSPPTSAEAIRKDSLRILEALRIGVLFVSHLCVDDFQGAVGGRASSDTPQIPPLVLDAFAHGGAAWCAEMCALMRQLLMLMSQLLQLQMHVLSLENGLNHPLLSPLLIQSLLHFYAEYIIRYFDADPTLYSARAAVEVSSIFTIHAEDIHSTLEMLAIASNQLLHAMPLESEVVQSISHMFISISRCSKIPGNDEEEPFLSIHRLQRRSPRVVERMLSQPGVVQIFHLVTGRHQQDEIHVDDNHHPHSRNQQHHPPQLGLCRLNSDGITAIYLALAELTIRANNEASFTQLCMSAHSRVLVAATASAAEANATSSDNKHASHGAGKWLIEHAVSSLKGIAAAPSGQDRVLHGLFDECLPMLTNCMHAYTAADDLLKLHLQLLRDYAEAQLSTCNAHSSHTLYAAALGVLQQCASRLNLPLPTTTILAGNSSTLSSSGSLANDEESSFRSELLLTVLQLLNHLATKDFLLDDDEDATEAAVAVVGNASAARLGQTVSSVLIFGFECMVPLISADILRSFPQTADRYFSFITFMVGTYEQELAQRISANTTTHEKQTGVQFFAMLIQHLLWGAGAVDSCCARLAMQALQTMAMYQVNSLRRGKEGYGHIITTEIFPDATARLLEMVLFPNTCEYGISWDRLDGCANAMLSLIALDVPKFSLCVQALVMQQPEFVRSTLIASFEKLTTSSGLSLSKIDKPNRMVFAKNLKQFVLEVRPLVLYH